MSRRERALLELFSETGSVEGLVEVRQLVKSARNERLPLWVAAGRTGWASPGWIPPWSSCCKPYDCQPPAAQTPSSSPIVPWTPSEHGWIAFAGLGMIETPVEQALKTLAGSKSLWQPLKRILQEQVGAAGTPLDPALRDTILQITILGSFLEATAQQLRPQPPSEMMRFGGLTP